MIIIGILIGLIIGVIFVYYSSKSCCEFDQNNPPTCTYNQATNQETCHQATPSGLCVGISRMGVCKIIHNTGSNP
jgi:hypothetical protein